jgi:hypothetical protein
LKFFFRIKSDASTLQAYTNELDDGFSSHIAQGCML